MGRTKRDSGGAGNDVKKCETCLRREERLMQIQVQSAKVPAEGMAYNRWALNLLAVTAADWLGNANSATLSLYVANKNNDHHEQSHLLRSNCLWLG